MITTSDFIALQVAANRAQKALTEAHAHRARWFSSEAHAAIRATRDGALSAIKAGSKGAPARRAAIEAEYQAAVDADAPAVPDGERAVLDADRALDRALAELKPVLDAVRDACAESVLRAGKVRVRIGHPRAEHHASTTWDRYSKAWHRAHGPATVHETEVRVPAEWCERVQARGLAVCDGLLTLDAEPAEAPAGYEAFRACWAENGRGYDVTEKHGFIVRALGRDASTAHVDHGGTVAQGVALLRRRAKSAWARQAAATADLNDYRHVCVSLADSRSAGNCDAGTRSWCARAGIVPEDGATVGDVLDALKNGAGLDWLALAACRVAVARVVKVAA